MYLPTEFLESLATLFPEAADRDALAAALETEPPVSIRFNPYKLPEKPGGDPVPWSRYGFYLAVRPNFTLDPLFHGGAYYVQEASSIFLEHLYRQVMPERTGVRILDLCAAPGGKTTLLSTLAGVENLIVANEPIRARAQILAENVRRWGLGNVAVTANDPAHFGALRHYFDLMVVDAPCSGEGMFRKEHEARREWNTAAVELSAARQRRILADAWEALKPEGILIYSTCTFNRRENEENIAWLLGQYECEGVPVETDPAWGILRGEVAAGRGMSVPTFRFYPHNVRGEGFFCAVLRKGSSRIRPRLPKARRPAPFSALDRRDAAATASWFGQPERMQFARIGDTVYGYYAAAFSNVRMLSEHLSVIYSGLPAGQLYHGKLKPEHALALFHDLSRDAAPETPLTLEQAREYLRRRDLDCELFAEGLNLISYGGLPIGWLKRIGRRTNNLYPIILRIVNFN